MGAFGGLTAVITRFNDATGAADKLTASLGKVVVGVQAVAAAGRELAASMTEVANATAKGASAGGSDITRLETAFQGFSARVRGVNSKSFIADLFDEASKKLQAGASPSDVMKWLIGWLKSYEPGILHELADPTISPELRLLDNILEHFIHGGGLS